MQNVGLSLRVAIAKKGMRPSQFADSYGWSRQRVSQFFKQETAQVDLVKKLADHFGMSVDEFLDLTK
jgi:transcriptional regulator with XRE-family HTH domain